MILEKQTNAEILEEGTGESIGMSLDMDSAQILMQMLSKNLYSDAIGSTIREAASNALDSHRRAGVDKPIIVSFKPNKDNSYEFTVEDFGIGLDDDDVKNIISKYGKSTKRHSNTELGMMGLGFKSPLAYCSSFYFICRKNGIERKYMMYEGEDVNSIDLMDERKTEEGNGVKVIVPVNYYDRNDFYKKIKEQLAYFENVYFDCGDYIKNDFSIYRGEDFQYSELYVGREMHICLDNVYYPLDFSKMGISNIQVSVGLRFNLGDGLFPTPNRETIIYSKEAKEAISNKIKKVADVFMTKYNESIVEAENFNQIADFFNNSSMYVNDLIIGKSFEINSLREHSNIKTVEPTMKGISLLNLKQVWKSKDYLLNNYNIHYVKDHKRIYENKRSYDKIINWWITKNLNDSNCYIYSEKFSGKIKDYMREFTSNQTKFVKFKQVMKLGSFRNDNNIDYNTYYWILGLSKYSKNQWRQVIKEFQSIVEGYTKHFIDLDGFVIPQDWMDSKKKSKGIVISNGVTVRRMKLQGEVTGSRAEKLERWVDGKNCKWVSHTYKLEDMHKIRHLIIYGSTADVEMMDKLFNLTNSIEFIKFSDRELKNIEKIKIHNLINVNKFMKGENKMFKRIITAYLIHNLEEKYNSVFNNCQKLDSVSHSLSSNLKLLSDYSDKWYINSNDVVYQAMLIVATEQKLFDQSIYSIYIDIKNMLDDMYFLNPLCKQMYYNNADLVPIIRDMFKYYKKRIDWKNYNIPLNEEVQEVLSDEAIEELINE